MSAGYIYILSNPSMPGLLKIGKTDRQPETRALELRTTGVPTPFTIEFSLLVANSNATEAIVHSTLEAMGCRTHKAREFFEISIGEAIDTVRAVCDGSELTGKVGQHSSTSIAMLSSLYASGDIPTGDDVISEATASTLADRLLELARFGHPGALQRAATIYLRNCPSAMRFRQYSRDFLRALYDDAAATSDSTSAVRSQDAGRMAADYVVRLLERRWTNKGDFEFLVAFLAASPSVRLGFDEAIRNSKLPESVQAQVLAL